MSQLIFWRTHRRVFWKEPANSTSPRPCQRDMKPLGSSLICLAGNECWHPRVLFLFGSLSFFTVPFPLRLSVRSILAVKWFLHLALLAWLTDMLLLAALCVYSTITKSAVALHQLQLLTTHRPLVTVCKDFASLIWTGDVFMWCHLMQEHWLIHFCCVIILGRMFNQNLAFLISALLSLCLLRLPLDHHFHWNMCIHFSLRSY